MREEERLIFWSAWPGRMGNSRLVASIEREGWVLESQRTMIDVARKELNVSCRSFRNVGYIYSL